MKLPPKLVALMEDWEAHDAYGAIRLTYTHGKVTRYTYGCDIKVEEASISVDQVPKRLVRKSKGMKIV